MTKAYMGGATKVIGWDLAKGEDKGVVIEGLRDRRTGKIRITKVLELCPRCSLAFDPKKHQLVECPNCGLTGSAKCCNPAGRGCLCRKCEEER